MIWGGRLLSPTGLFAAENADVVGQAHQPPPDLPDRRPDRAAETFPMAATASSRSISAAGQSPPRPYTLTQVVENRFAVACNEVKKRTSPSG
jgi:hypothetical protein